VKLIKKMEADQMSNCGSSNNRLLGMKDFLDYLDDPANIKKAMLHGRCQRALKVISTELEGIYVTNIDVECCDDCFLPEPTKGKVEPFRLCDKMISFGHLGTGIFFYFFYLKFLILVLCIVGGMITIPAIMISRHYNTEMMSYCNSNTTKTYPKVCNDFLAKDNDWLYSMNCDNLKFYTLYLNQYDGEIRTNVVDYSFIVFLALLVLFFAKIFFVIIVDAIDNEIDMLNITPADYTLMVSNIPMTIRTKEAIIEEYISIPNPAGKNGIDSRIKPIELNMTYKIADYVKTKNEFLRLQKITKKCELKKKTIYNRCCQKGISIIHLKTKLDEISKRLNNYLHDIDNPEKKLFTGVVFATFNTSKEYNLFLDQFPRTYFHYAIALIKYLFARFLCRCICDAKKINKLHHKLTLRVVPAPEPTDVLWENLEVNFLEGVIRTLICYLITFILLGISFAIILGLNIYQTDLPEDSSDFDKYAISTGISLIITIVNTLVVLSMNVLTDYERKVSVSVKYLSNSLKLQMVSQKF
jgi:hypothetical protein